MYYLTFINDAFGAVIDDLSPAEHGDLISQGLLLVKIIHKDQPDIVEQCDFWLQNKPADKPIYDPKRVEILKTKSNEADLIYLHLEKKRKKEKSDLYFRRMCAFNGLYQLFEMKEYTLRQIRNVIYDFANSSTDPDQFGRDLERNTILALRWQQPGLTDLLPVDANLDLDVAALKDFYNCKEEDLTPPQRIKTFPGKRLAFQLKSLDPEKEVFLSLGGLGLALFATGMLLYCFNIINLIFGLLFFILGGGLMILTVWAFVSRFQGIKNCIESLEIEKHPVKRNEITKIDIVFNEPVRLDRLVVTLDCCGYDGDMVGEPGAEGNESLWSRQLVFSKEPFKLSSNDLRLTGISIHPTTLYSTDSPMKKVFWFIAVNYWIGKRMRRKVFPIIVAKE